MSVTNIRFSDLIQFPDDNNVKIRFNSDNGYYNPLDSYPTKRDEAALEWLRWRPERACFYVGNLVINFFECLLRTGFLLEFTKSLVIQVLLKVMPMTQKS